MVHMLLYTLFHSVFVCESGCAAHIASNASALALEFAHADAIE